MDEYVQYQDDVTMYHYPLPTYEVCNHSSDRFCWFCKEEDGKCIICANERIKDSACCKEHKEMFDNTIKLMKERHWKAFDIEFSKQAIHFLER